jgi:hypothetical protein
MFPKKFIKCSSARAFISATLSGVRKGLRRSRAARITVLGSVDPEVSASATYSGSMNDTAPSIRGWRDGTDSMMASLTNSDCNSSDRSAGMRAQTSASKSGRSCAHSGAARRISSTAARRQM